MRWPCSGRRKLFAASAIVLASLALMAIFPAPQGAVASPHDGAPQAVIEQLLYTFCISGKCVDGSGPAAGLIMDGKRNLYGTTAGGGSSNNRGVVFELTPSGSGWTETVLYRFCPQSGCADGASPQAGLIMDGAGNLYGTTAQGGSLHNAGVVFQLTPSGSGWAQQVLYTFCPQSGCAHRSPPHAGLIMDRTGNLFGTTSNRG